MDFAVLMMAYGGPNSLEDVEPYLLDVRGGRATSHELVEEVRKRYAAIGRRSPLLDITRAQATELEGRLNSMPGDRFRVYAGMRHWYPYIHEAVAQIAQDGLQRVIGLCMAPQYSRMSIGAYYQRLEEATRTSGASLEITRIESWHTHPLFIQALAERVDAGLRRFPAAERDRVAILFTAHSLPAALIEQGDPYDAQVRQTAALVASELGLREDESAQGERFYRFCYQSAGAGNVRWLGPDIQDVIVELADAGHANILVAPVGFTADHVETLYDLDILGRDTAARHGSRLERTEGLNTSPTFIAALAEIVRAAV